MLHIVLFQPQIPQNTGNVGRLCALNGVRLHLIHPLGFQITDKQLRRSGMDYWRELDVHHHANWDALMSSAGKPSRCWLFSTHATTIFWDVEFEDGDGMVFGNEGEGAPSWLHEACNGSRLKIPQLNKHLRSMNLATSVGIAAYEGLRQLHHGGGACL